MISDERIKEIEQASDIIAHHNSDIFIKELLTERKQLVEIAEILEMWLRANPLAPGSHRLAEVLLTWKEEVK